MTAGRKKRWKGELSRPIQLTINRPKGLAIIDPETVSKANEEMTYLYEKALAAKFFDKLRLLMKHYGISEEDDWFGLSLALAIDHVPGFRVDHKLEIQRDPQGNFVGAVTFGRKKVGRRTAWDFDRLERLLTAVQEERRKFGIRTDREALSRLASRREWARPATHRGEEQGWLKTLVNRLQEAKKFKRLLDKAAQQLAESAREIAGNNPGNFKRV